MAEVQTYGIVLSPAISRLDLLPGKTITGELVVYNAFEEGRTVTLSTKILDLFQQNGAPIIIPEDKPMKGLSQYSMRSWISVSESRFTLKHGEKKTIKYFVKVPLNPLPGGKYSTVVFHLESSENPSDGSKVALNEDLGHVIIGKIPGTEVKESDIESFTVNKPYFFNWPNEDIQFNLVVKNNGNIDLLPSGDIFVHQGDITKSAANFPINDKEQVIFPETSREYVINWPKKTELISFDKGGININLDYLRFGKYTATAKIGHDSGNVRVVTEKTVEFWILPWYIILCILLAAAVFVGIIVRKLTKWQKNKKKTVR